MNHRLRLSLAPALLSLLSAEVCAAGYVFTNVADTMTTGPIGTFSRFDPPAISGNAVAFAAASSDGGGVFRANGASLTTIAKSGDPGALFGHLAKLGDAAISGDNVAFLDVHIQGGSAVYVGSGGPLTTIVKSHDAAPFGTFWELQRPSISGNTVAFSGTYRPTVTDVGRTGIFTGSGGPVTPVAKDGDSSMLSAFGDPSISRNTIAFSASFGNRPGVFSANGGVVTTVAQWGGAAPIGQFIQFQSASISGNNVAFLASYTATSGNDAVIGVFSGTGGTVTPIAKTGDAAPSGFFFNFGFGTPATSGETVAFQGSYNGGNGIFVGSGGPLATVIKKGDPLFGGIVSSLGFGRFGLDAGGSGNLAFQYVLSDGRHGVAIASPVPEPPTILLALVGACGMAFRSC